MYTTDVVITARTLEIFVESLLTKASQVTRARNARTLTPAHLKASINAESQFSFLRDMVAAVPDFQNALEDEALLPCEPTSSSSVQTAFPTTRLLSRPRSVRTATVRRGRPRKSAVRETERSVSTCEEDDEADDLDEDEEDGDEDEGSSCDNSSMPSAAGATTTTTTKLSFPAPLVHVPPLLTTAPHVIDDDYDAV